MQLFHVAVRSLAPFGVLAMGFTLIIAPTARAQQPDSAETPPQQASPSLENPSPSAAKPGHSHKKKVGKKTEKEKAAVQSPPATGLVPPFGALAGDKAPHSPAAPPGAPRTLAEVAAAGSAGAADIASKLTQAGAGTCAESIDLAAASSMVGATQYNTLSIWSDAQPRDKHAASVVIAQHYEANPAVPYGATTVTASPGPSGGCDATVVQVVSSPLPCSNVRESLTGKNKQAVNLAGIALVQSGTDQTLLMPTGTNTCVVIGIKSMFAK